MMKKYDPDAKCPKCGCEDVRTFYHNERSYRHDDICYGVDHEHFHRTCERCKYHWVEDVLGGPSEAERSELGLR